MIKTAVNFKLKDKNGKDYSLDSFTSDYIVLYFYPKDSTPGCTTEAIEFTKNLEEFKKLNTTIIGISGGDEKTKQKFCEKNNLKILLLSDSDFSISKKYGVYGEKSFMGRKFMGIKRTTFLLDKNKNIIKVYENVKPLGHSEEILDFLENQK